LGNQTYKSLFCTLQHNKWLLDYLHINVYLQN
jgi:hypothetical protein